MKKIIVLSIMALVLSPLNPIFHIAKASVIPEQIFEPIVDAEGHCLNCNNEGSIDPMNDEDIAPTPGPIAEPCPGPAFSNDSSISLVLPCPIIPGPSKDLINAEAVDEDIVLPPTPTPCFGPSLSPNSAISVILPCPIVPGPSKDLINAEAVDEDIVLPPTPTPTPCPAPAFNSVIGPSIVLPCPIVPGPSKDLINAEAVDEDIILPPTPTPVPCPTPIASVDSIIFPTPILIQPCPAPAIDPVEEEEEGQITPPGPPAGGGGGGGISIFQTNVLGTTPPTTTDQQVLGEQVFSDGTPTQQVLGEQKFASVLGEKVTSPSFPKTGSATNTTNSILWQLSLAFLLSAALIVSLNQKKTVLASK